MTSTINEVLRTVHDVTCHAMLLLPLLVAMPNFPGLSQ